MNDNQAAARVSVVARDPDRLAVLIRAQRPYSAIGKAAGVSGAFIGEIALGRRRRVKLSTATALERALAQPPGSLFQVDPDTAHVIRPYLV